MLKCLPLFALLAATVAYGHGQYYPPGNPRSEPWVNVKDFGALGNGVADDVVAAEAAVAALPASGGCVYFPPGDYFLGSTFNINRDDVCVRGDGMEATTFTKVATGVYSLITIDANIDRFSLYDVGCEGTGAGTPVGSCVSSTNDTITGTTISRVRVRNMASGFHLEGTDLRGGRLPDPKEVRDMVKRDWAAERQRELKDAAYAKIRERYVVELEKPASMSSASAAEAGKQVVNH